MRSGRQPGRGAQPRMPDFQLTRAAEQDLMGIALYGDERFGEDQSNLYRDQLREHFSRLAQNPRLYPAVDHIRPGYRRSVCAAHAVYYRIQTPDILIVRILGRQDAHRMLPARADVRD